MLDRNRRIFLPVSTIKAVKRQLFFSIFLQGLNEFFTDLQDRTDDVRNNQEQYDRINLRGMVHD